MRSAGKIILVSLTPACLEIAARGYRTGDKVRAAGGKSITLALQQCLNETTRKEVHIVVPYVEQPLDVRAKLDGLGQAGIQVSWFAPAASKSVRQACVGLSHVRLLHTDSLIGSLDCVYPPLSLNVDENDPKLQDYFRYKITLSLMKMQEPDFFPNPVPLEEILILLRKGVFRLSPEEERSLQNFSQAEFPYLEGQSPVILELKKRIQKVACTDMSVLIVGETGTGKEAVAFFLHEFSNRRSKPYGVVNCAGLDEHFLRSELFGHVKGAYTGAHKDRQGLVKEVEGGTLFLDEVTDMPLQVQAELLRFLQTKHYRPLGSEKEQETKADLRIIAAAQTVLKEKLSTGQFRRDLYYRLAEVQLYTPALAEVPEDIIRIVRNIAYRHEERDISRKAIAKTVSYFEKGREILEKAEWKGNVRELAGCVNRHLLLGDDVLSELDHQRPMEEAFYFRPINGEIEIKPVDEIIRNYIGQVYQHKGKHSQRKIATLLGISVNTLKKYLAQ
jgi:two-component system, NtrC family, nitrogen regulation response regulator NtrX